MDQLKVAVKQCVKYRFWIAFGISILLPLIAYFVGSGTINAETTKREAEITGAKNEIGKYTAGGIVNAQYQPLAAAKKAVLTQDVDATWRKLFATQEPLLKWPEEVQPRFRAWGRKYPADVDKSQITSTLIDYTILYPEFVEKIYKVFKPFNFEDGTGIVVAPVSAALLTPAPFRQDEPPDLSKVWAEQERLWVVTALLDVIAKVNDSVGAKDWDGAIVKEIRFLEVGSPSDQDQKSIAKGDVLVPADTLSPDGTTAAAAPPPSPTPGSEGGGSVMNGGPGLGSNSREVFYLPTISPQYKSLPIKMTVLVEQAKLPNYLVGLENSPMAIQVAEIEVAKPVSPVMKPAYGERASFGNSMMGMGSDAGGRGEEKMRGGGSGMMGRAMGGGMAANSARGASGGGNGMEEMMRGQRGGGGIGGPAAKPKSGTDNRNTNASKDRKDAEKREKDAAKARAEAKKVDQYFNVVEVTVYGQARFYLSPPPAPQSEASAAPAAPATEAPKVESPTLEAPKAEPPKAEAPKPNAPAADGTKKEDAPKAEPAAPKEDAPKAEPSAPKR